MTAAQEAVFAFLADPATHSLTEPVKRIDTNGAAVFLAGPDVYKIKRAVRFPFMDLSTLEKRHAICEAEIAVNRHYAPHLYHGVVPISRAPDGSLRLGGDGEVTEWAVHMRRFNETMTLDLVAPRDGLMPGLLKRLATTVVDAFVSAEVRDGIIATNDLAGVVEETVTSLTERTEVFPAADTLAFADALRMAFDSARPLLLERGDRGYARRCHGDLHLRNIVLIDGKPILFDAIEFDEHIATIDIFYDFAFLLMDMWERGFRPEANQVLNRYLWQSETSDDDLQGLALLPLLMALRAAVRAKVEALRHVTVDGDEAARADAVRYFDQAEAFLTPAPARLVAIGGFSGTGKTTLSRAIAHAIGRAPGAVHLRSDIERKRLMDVDELDQLPSSAYEADVTEAVFATLRRDADLALRAGHSVIVDAVHKIPEERRAIEAVARAAGAPFTGLWLTAPVEMLIDRISHRTDDASDATAAVVMLQADQPFGPIDWTSLDATRPLETMSANALRAIGDAS
ncbi:AAA family ATPase [Bauldia sp.]|uniref:bifunctional aminoglycoside phosphotransferase/ATP-binding protein n=1 Tax=Bauldia sp. TaxID=2575872 RepID=UPI003BAD6C98